VGGIPCQQQKKVYGLALLAYTITALGIVMDNLPLDALVENPPVMSLGGASLALLVGIVAVEALIV